VFVVASPPKVGVTAQSEKWASLDWKNFLLSVTKKSHDKSAVLGVYNDNAGCSSKWCCALSRAALVFILQGMVGKSCVPTIIFSF
jgi:hypothetical protein